MAACVKIDDHGDYQHHCYGDRYVSVPVDPFEHFHKLSSFSEVLPGSGFLGSKITAVSGALPCDKLGHSNFQIRTNLSELGQYRPWKEGTKREPRVKAPTSPAAPPAVFASRDR